MTIIAAMRESDDSILIGADSGETNTNKLRSLNLKKLQRHNRLPLAWGAAGNTYMGVDSFAEWLTAFEPNDSAKELTWNNLKEACENKMADIIRRQVDLGNRSGIRFTPIMNGVLVLLTGYLEKKLRIAEIDYDGKWSFVHQPFHAIGMMSHALAIHYTTIEKTHPPNCDDFDSVLESGARSFQMCDPPIHIWRITSKGIEVVKE